MGRCQHARLLEVLEKLCKREALGLHINLPVLLTTAPGLVSARLVNVEMAESGPDNDRRFLVRKKLAACRPGAEWSSERFLATNGAFGGLGRIPASCLGTERSK